ncbi:MAG: ABC transporter permease [Nitrospirota bacterium]|nr:MAG: ABC transporter permease [Nitrospirota bacterium]
MSFPDTFSLALGSVMSRRGRSGLSLLGIAIGVAAVIVLTSIGEGIRQFILNEFSQFGTNLLSVTPGNVKTLGIPGVLGGTTHKLTLDDAEAIRQIDGIERVVPTIAGSARVEADGRGRSVSVFGVTSETPEHWKVSVRQGTFLPEGDVRRRQAVAVLGPKLKHELFADANPLGQFVRIAGYRFRVLGVMAPKGHLLGFDIDDAVYVPVASGMSMFNLDELMEIQIAFSYRRTVDKVEEDIRQLLMERHRGEEDFTITTQAAMLDTLDSVMNVVTTAVGIIAGISLIVGAIGILTVMWMAVKERTAEIGLLKATGATSGQIYQLVLLEALMLAVIGGGVGFAIGVTLSTILPYFVPRLPTHLHTGYILAALFISAFTGISSGLLPAHRAASIDPVQALHAN